MTRSLSQVHGEEVFQRIISKIDKLNLSEKLREAFWSEMKQVEASLKQSKASWIDFEAIQSEFEAKSKRFKAI